MTLRQLKERRKALDEATPVKPGTSVVLPDEARELLGEYEEAAAQADACATRLEFLRLRFAELTGSAEVGVIPDTNKEVFRGEHAVAEYVVPARVQRECRIRKASVIVAA